MGPVRATHAPWACLVPPCKSIKDRVAVTPLNSFLLPLMVVGTVVASFFSHLCIVGSVLVILDSLLVIDISFPLKCF